ncbi:MAG: EamA family transporter [Acetobacteraceae bacterium]|nr:EamA family transporter [Acetobacteraceae bacterium]
MTPYWLSLLAAIAVGVAGQLLLKLGSDNVTEAGAGGMLQQLLRPTTMAGLACYGLAALFYIIALRKIPVSVALPSAALQYLVVAAMGWVAFREPFGWMQGLGLGLILVGVSLLALSTRGA